MTTLSPGTVEKCYAFWEHTFRKGGILDLSEGYYDGCPTLSIEEAQARKFDYLLNQADCKEGTRILDIGCGNGSLLLAAKKRGAIVAGLTLSLEQASYCQSQGLDVRVCNYRNLPKEWLTSFDAVIANGSMEHFVQRNDVANGRANEIYKEFFEVVGSALDPKSSTQKLINTTIHLDTDAPGQTQGPNSKGPSATRRWQKHYDRLCNVFGGSYPYLGQLQNCAMSFTLLTERDATQDYHLTSEYWLDFGRKTLLSVRGWRDFWPFLSRHPIYSASMFNLLFVSQSWNWQFRGHPAPMKHLWQSWEFMGKSKVTE